MLTCSVSYNPLWFSLLTDTCVYRTVLLQKYVFLYWIYIQSSNCRQHQQVLTVIKVREWRHWWRSGTHRLITNPQPAYTRSLTVHSSIFFFPVCVFFGVVFIHSYAWKIIIQREKNTIVLFVDVQSISTLPSVFHIINTQGWIKLSQRSD